MNIFKKITLFSLLVFLLVPTISYAEDVAFETEGLNDVIYSRSGDIKFEWFPKDLVIEKITLIKKGNNYGWTVNSGENDSGGYDLRDDHSYSKIENYLEDDRDYVFKLESKDDIYYTNYFNFKKGYSEDIGYDLKVEEVSENLLKVTWSSSEPGYFKLKIVCNNYANLDSDESLMSDNCSLGVSGTTIKNYLFDKEDSLEIKISDFNGEMGVNFNLISILPYQETVVVSDGVTIESNFDPGPDSTDHDYKYDYNDYDYEKYNYDNDDDLDIVCRISDTRVREDDRIRIEVDIDGGDSPYDIQWSGDDNDIDDFDDDARSQYVRMEHEGSYRLKVTVKDDDGNRETDTCPTIYVDDDRKNKYEYDYDYDDDYTYKSYDLGDNYTYRPYGDNYESNNQNDLSKQQILDLLTSLFGKNSEIYNFIKVLIEAGLIE